MPEVKQFGYGKPLSVLPLDEAWRWWRDVTTAADGYLDTITSAVLTQPWRRDRSGETPGMRLHRNTYHCWFHLGESQAVRQSVSNMNAVSLGRGGDRADL